MGSFLPDTRASLIGRLQDAGDVEAWGEFVDIYQPLIYRLARGRGLQEADAHDVVQEVLWAVSRAAQRWVPDPQRGRFRDWLSRIARNLAINFLTRPRHRPWARGGSDAADWWAQQSEPDVEDTVRFDQERRRELFQWAADEVRCQVHESTWQAFYRSAVLQEPVTDVADSLHLSVGAVYIARSRVMARLRQSARKWDPSLRPGPAGPLAPPQGTEEASP